MIVELICVGTEMLLGNIVNTNAQYIAQRAAALGLSMYHQDVVGDNEKRLEDTITSALLRSDIIILSGGLGPTDDDITKEVAAKVFEMPLVMHEPSKKHIIDFFAAIQSNITSNNWKQAMVPEGATILPNENGTAPGLIMEKAGKTMILLPGPPTELYPMFEHQVEPYLKSKIPEVLVSSMVKVCGIGESQTETMIKDMLCTQTNPTIAPYAKLGEVHLRVTARAKSRKEAEKLIIPVVEELKNRFGENIYTTEEAVTLEEAVVRLLKKHDLKLATAESCTGGMIGSRLVNVAGISDIYRGGFVTYSNKLKKKCLDVSKKTLKTYGAVSHQTAKEMARGCLLAADADVAVAVTGIAGPGGGTEEKPVGLVYISCAFGEELYVQECHFTGDRETIRTLTASFALDMVRRCVLRKYGN